MCEIHLNVINISFIFLLNKKKNQTKQDENSGFGRV